MDNLSKLKYHGLSMQKLNRCMAAVSLVISVLLLLATDRTNGSYSVMRTATENYITLKQSVDDIETTSDFLSDQTRFFTVTGDLRYVDEYFNEVREVRRRETALQTLFDRLGQTEAGIWATMAVEQSKSLQEKEYYAMRLMATACGYTDDQLPEEIVSIALSAEDAALEPAKQMEAAGKVLLSENYVHKKDIIADTMKLCLRSLVMETKQQQYNSLTSLHDTLLRQRTLVFVLIGLILLVVVITSVLLISPLVNGVSHIQNEQPIPIRGAAEFRFLAKTYNMMFEANRERTERLAYEATHDKLTGLYNRNGYEFLMQNADLDGCALLLIDVDKFKNVNDTYGHDMGDRALVRVASVLSDSFRGEDYICRVGGDEFAAIMVNAGPQFADLIREKVSRINNKLLHPTDDLPPLSLSVGVAFGGAHGSGHLAKDADAALYQVKEAGRCGCAVYTPGKAEKT